MTTKRLVLVVGIVFLGFFMFSLAGLMVQGRSIGLRSEAIAADIATQKTANIKLATEVARMETDAAVEAAAREQLGYVKEGETAVIIDYGPAGPPQVTPTPTSTPVPNWQLWADFFRSR